MNKEELSSLWKQFLTSKEAGVICEKSYKQLVEHYYPLVQKIAQKLHIKINHLSIDELTSMGVDGLYDAISKFDPVRFNNKFETYAARRIKGNMLDEIRKSDWIPRLVRSRSSKFEKNRQIIESRKGYKMSTAQLAEEIGMSEIEADKMVAMYNPPVMYNFNDLNEDDSGMSIEQIEDGNFVDPSESIIRKEFFNKLMGLNFTPQERKIIWLYYFENRNMKEISDKVNLSESRVSQMHNKIIQRLKHKVDRNPTYFGDIWTVVKKFKGTALV